MMLRTKIFTCILLMFSSVGISAQVETKEPSAIETSPADSLSLFATKRFMVGLHVGTMVGTRDKWCVFPIPDLGLDLSLRLYDKLWFWAGNFDAVFFECGLKYYVPFSARTALYAGVGPSMLACGCSGGGRNEVTANPLAAVKLGVQHFLRDDLYFDFFTAGNFGKEFNLFRCGIGIGLSF